MRPVEIFTLFNCQTSAYIATYVVHCKSFILHRCSVDKWLEKAVKSDIIRISILIDWRCYNMSVFKSYLRQLIRQLKALQKANKDGKKEEVERIINELLKDAQDGLEDD